MIDVTKIVTYDSMIKNHPELKEELIELKYYKNLGVKYIFIIALIGFGAFFYLGYLIGINGGI